MRCVKVTQAMGAAAVRPKQCTCIFAVYAQLLLLLPSQLLLPSKLLLLLLLPKLLLPQHTLTCDTMCSGYKQAQPRGISNKDLHIPAVHSCSSAV